MKFCPYCGKNVDGKPCDCEGYLAAQAEEAARSEKPKKEVNISKVQLDLKKLIVPIFLILALLGGVLAYSTYANTLDLGDYIDAYDTYGFDGSGSVEYSVNTEALALDYFGEEYESLNNGSYSEADLMRAMSKLESMSNEIDNIILCIVDVTEGNEGLSNGDTITIAFDFENTNNYKFSKRIKGGEITYTVDGLKDAFDDDAVSVTFKGVNGDGTVKIDVVNEEPYYNYVYKAEPEDGLSNGDTITLSVVPSYYTEPLTGETQKEIVVSGLGEYVTLEDELSQDLVDEFYNFALAEVTERQSHWTTPLGEPTVDKIYFVAATDNTTQQGYLDYYYNSFEYRNMLVAITTYGQDSFFYGEMETQYVIAVPNCLINEAGEITFDESAAITNEYNDETPDSVANKLINDYPALTYIELPIA